MEEEAAGWTRHMNCIVYDLEVDGYSGEKT